MKNAEHLEPYRLNQADIFGHVGERERKMQNLGIVDTKRKHIKTNTATETACIKTAGILRSVGCLSDQTLILSFLLNNTQSHYCLAQGPE